MKWNTARLKERMRSVMLAAVTLVLIGLVFYLGTRSERSGFVREVIDPGFRSLSDPVLNAFRGKPPAVAQLHITMEPADFDSLELRSERAYRDQRVLGSFQSNAAARIAHGDSLVNATIMLREGLLNNSRQRFWPLHVRLAPGDTLLDMQSFDVVPITDDVPLWSMLLHTVRADEGLSALGSGLAEVSVNGISLGLCALYGRTDATMVARWSRGSGPVLRFSEDLMLNARAEVLDRKFPSQLPPQGDWLAAPLLIQSGLNDRNSPRARKAVQRLEAFRSGNLIASQVFDVKDLARSMALCDLLGTPDALDWWNLRFLVDSLTEEIVPIPLHLGRRAPIDAILAQQSLEGDTHTGKEIVDKALEDPEVLGAYLAYLDTFTTEGWWEVVRERTRASWQTARNTVHAEFPRLDLDLDVVLHDRTVIRQALYPRDVALAYVNDTLSNTDGIVIANVHSLPIEVVGVILTSGDTTSMARPIRLDPRARDKPLRYTFLPLNVPGSPREVLLRVGPTLKPRAVRIRTWSSFGAN